MLKRLKKLSINFLLLSLSLIIAVLIAEVILRFTPYRYLFVSYVGSYVCADKNSGYDICDNHPPVKLRGAEYDWTIWSNELGCFDRSYEGEKNYILLVGDSYTFGHNAFENKYGMLLEKYLDYRVLKCGVGGYGTIQEFYKIKKVLQKTGTTPQLIVVGYWMGDDLRNDLDCLQKGIKLPQEVYQPLINIEEINGLFKPAHSLHEPSRSLRINTKDWIKNHSLLYYLFNKNIFVRAMAEKFGFINYSFQYLSFLPVDKNPWLEKSWRFHLVHLREIKKLADTYKCRLLIILLPADIQVYNFLQPKEVYDIEQPNRILRNFFQKEGIDYLDLTGFFRMYANQKPRMYLDSKGELFLNHDRHFTKKGEKLTALIIAQYIAEHDLLEIQNKIPKKINIEKELYNLRTNHK